MSVAWNADVDIAVEAAFGDAPYATPTWTDISSYMRTVEIRRGAPHSPTPKTAAGTCTLTLDNIDGRFDPNNTLSPYSPDVVLTVPIRIQAVHNVTTYPLFYGFVTAWNVMYPDKGLQSVVAVECADVLQLLNQFDLNGESYAAQDTDVRVGAVLDAAGFPAGWRNLDSGVGQVEALADGQNISAYQHLGSCAAAEHGRVFVDASGDVTFHNRIHHAGGATSEGTFGPVNLQYKDVTPRYDDQHLYNDAVYTGTFGTVATSDATSIAANRERTLAVATIAADANTALNAAEWAIASFKDMATRVDSVDIQPQSDPSNMWPVVLGVDLRDSITVATDPPGSGDALNQQVTIEQVVHTIDVDEWATAYSCFPLATNETYDYWVLGTSTLGTGTRLA